MKLSIVVICWNNLSVIVDCLKSIFEQTNGLEYEVIVTDNGSQDESVSTIRRLFPQVLILENGKNLGFAAANNAGIRVAKGELVLILNPDTIILNRALNKLVEFADAHPEAGAFGCRVLNPDRTWQNPARPLPTPLGYFIAAVGCRWLAHLSPRLESDTYVGWEGRTVKRIGFQSGCCVLFRSRLLKELNGFDERFFYHFEETDLCKRVWASGSQILFCPDSEIIHLGWQSLGTFPVRFAIETYRNCYKYFYKHYGYRGIAAVRRICQLRFFLRLIGYTVIAACRPKPGLSNRLQIYKTALQWHTRIDPVAFISKGQEPDMGFEPLSLASHTSKKDVKEKSALPVV